MKMTTAGQLQNKFKSGLTMLGESNNELLWMGHESQFKKSEELDILDELSAEVMANDEPAW